MALPLSEVSQKVACAPVLAVMSSILPRSNRPARRVARGPLPVRVKIQFDCRSLISKPRNQPPRLIKCATFGSCNSIITCSTSACVAMSSLRSARHWPRRVRSMRLGHGVSPISHAKATSFSHQNPQVIDRSFLLCFDSQKSVGHQSSKDRSFSLAAARTRFWKFSLQLPEMQRPELIELLKYARDQRRSVSIHAQFLALVALFRDWFLLRHHGCCKAGRTPNYEDRR